MKLEEKIMKTIAYFAFAAILLSTSGFAGTAHSCGAQSSGKRAEAQSSIYDIA
jgi:hypothetical protein